MTNDLTAAVFVVVCEDNVVRHDKAFDTLAEAREFAQFGHCCTNRHHIQKVTP